MKAYEEAAQLLPPEYREAFLKYGGESAEEIRLRSGRKAGVVRCGAETELNTPAVSDAALLYVIEKATGASVHSAADTLKNGFISRHGLRIGVCGQAVMKNGEFAGYRSYSSVNIRIPRECKGIGGDVPDRLRESGYDSTLIISPPGGGKTTLLRELIRRAADEGKRVGVVDERNELSADGVFELGRCADVISMAPRRNGAMILLRGMNPQIIAMDEISSEEDVLLATELCGFGVHLLATAHAESVQDMRRRPSYRRLLDSGVFAQAVVIELQGERKYRFEKLI